MIALEFRCHGARPDPTAATPTLLFDLQVEEPTGVVVHAVRLQCQIRIEPTRRRYGATEAADLLDLFGHRERWADTLNPIQVCTVSTVVPGFTGSTRVALAVPCTYDTDVAAAKYFRALEEGGIPLLLLFSGSIFYAAGQAMMVAPVPWDREVRYDLPVATWRALMDLHFPGTAWIRLDRHMVETLLTFRQQRMLPTWEDTFASLLAAARVGEP